MIRYVSAEKFDKIDCKITCEKHPFWPWGKITTVQYVGSSTIWHRFPDGKRVDTELELWLCDRWTKWRWESRDAN